MSKTVINVSLSAVGLNRAIKEVDRFKRDFLLKVGKLMQAVADQGAEILRYKIVSMGAVMFGDLLASVSGVYAGNVAIIKMGTDHAAFVEFGTGVRGAQSPYPGTLSGWKYDINSHGEAGWWYWGDWDNNWHWTKGMPSRPVMYETSIEIPALVKKLAAEVFG